MSGADRGTSGDRYLLVLDDPILGLLPWLAWGLLPYVTSALTSAVAALLLAAALLGLTMWRGERPRALEISDVALFVPILVITVLGSDDLNEWFEDHADLVSNAGLTVLAFGSLVVRRPFTAPYTSARFPGMAERLQRRLDAVSTSAWGVGLLVATFVAWYGEFVLDNPNDFWTGWTLQLLPLLLAYHATLWYDQRALSIEAGATDTPSPWQLVRNVVLWLAPIGAIAILVNDAPLWLGEALIWIGLGGFVLAWALLRRRRSADQVPFVIFDRDEL